jgi:hypothetical protein
MGVASKVKEERRIERMAGEDENRSSEGSDAAVKVG